MEINKNLKNNLLIESILIFLVFLKHILQRNWIFNEDSDILWHIRQGEWFIDNLKIKTDTEIFSYLFEYREWGYISWLPDIIDASIYRSFGFAGVLLLYTFIFYIAIYIIFKYNINKGVSPIVIILSFIFLFEIIDYNFAVRTYIYSYFFMVLWYILINEYLSEKKYSKTIYFLFPLQLIWVNTHSTFIYGFIILFFFFIGSIIEWKKNNIEFKKLKKLFFISFVCFFVSLINPFGAKAYYFLLNINLNEAVFKTNYEFMPFEFNEYPSILFVFIIIIIILIWNLKKIKMWNLLLILFWMTLTIKFSRNMSILGLFLFLILPLLIDANLKKNNLKKNEQKNIYFPIFYLICILAFFWNTKTNILFDSKIYISNKYYVKGAVDYIKKQNIQGRIMNDYNIGTYLIWEFYPEKVVFFDSRASIYPKEVYEDLRKVYYFEKETPDILKKYKIEYVLFSKKLKKGIEGLKSLEKSKLIYEDTNSVLIKIEN